MTAEQPAYRRLTGKKKGFLVGYHHLWQGTDHLLQVYSRLGVEDYKRYYFNDIQAIITRRTDTGKIQNFVLGALTGLFGLFAATSGGGWTIFNTMIAGVMLLFLIINIIKGPTCETYLLTAVQTEKLHSLHRLKTTEPVMNRLRSIIEQVQGRINPEILAQQPAVGFTAQTRRIRPVMRQRSRQAKKPERGRVHLVLFVLLLVDSLFIIGGFFYTHVALSLGGTAIRMLLAICVIVALVKQHESNLKKSLRSITWAALGYVCFSFVAGYVVTMSVTFKHPEIWQNQWKMFQLLSDISPWDSPLLMTISIIALCGALIISIAGLFMLKKPQPAFQKPSVLLAVPISGSASKRKS